MSLPVRGAWVEIGGSGQRGRLSGRRSPCGERGLKFRACAGEKSQNESLPVRGAWVEIFRGGACASPSVSLPVRGAWIEMKASGRSCRWLSRRSPCGERGLKSLSSGGWCGRWWRRSPCGERGLKFCRNGKRWTRRGRSPCGERGLKSTKKNSDAQERRVAPRAGSVD